MLCEECQLIDQLQMPVVVLVRSWQPQQRLIITNVTFLASYINLPTVANKTNVA